MSRRKRHNELGDLFEAFVGMPWWIGPSVAAFLFIGLRFIIPAMLPDKIDPSGSPVSVLSAFVPVSQMAAPFVAWIVLVVWGLAEFRKYLNRRRLDGQTGLDSIGELSWTEFEELIAEAFRREGYVVERTGGGGSDGGVDVVLRRGGQTTLVQCKHWKAWAVGVKIIRELRGVMASARAEAGIVVTYGKFTSDAVVFARESGITLIGGEDLVELIRSVQKKRPAAVSIPEAVPIRTPTPPLNPAPVASVPACPLCGSAMVQRVASRGPNAGRRFWGCPGYPTCKGIRAI